jgi:ribosomal protein S27AE
MSGFDDTLSIENQPDLTCPRCGEQWLHHGEVRIYSRPIEDGPVQETIIGHHGNVMVAPRYAGYKNPSGRRDGIAIDLWCESCGEGSTLAIAQHKGMTSIGWRKEAPLSPPHPYVAAREEDQVS